MRRYNLFISHSWSYSEDYEALIDLLKNTPYFDFYDYSVPYDDYSVPYDDPIEIRSMRNYNQILENRIREKMKICSAIIVLAAVYATYSDSIEMEIKIAKELGKPIIAVETWGALRSSTRVIVAADKVVKWNGNSITDAIKEVCV